MCGMQVKLPKEEVDDVSDLGYGWRNLNRRSLEASEELSKLQVHYVGVVAVADR